MFRAKYSGYSNPILVTGAHRSGTTWLGKILAAESGTAYISEPLNVLHRPGILAADTSKWYTYICHENEVEYLKPLRDTLTFRYQLRSELTSLRSTKDLMRMFRDLATFWAAHHYRRRPICKDPFALFSAPWYADRLNCEVLIIMRHPAAFVSSLKRYGWDFPINDLLSQPLLMRDHLSPFEEDLKKCERDGDLIDRASQLWRVTQHVIKQFLEDSSSFKVVRHEDISSAPKKEFRTLFDSLGLEFTKRVENTITKTTKAGNPSELSRANVHSVKIDSRANIKNWKNRLSVSEVDRIRRITADISGYFYSDTDWL